jgi:hypothetical protein
MSGDTRFSVTCPACGDVELGAEQAWLVLADDPALVHYAFRCPRCEEHVRHHANGAIVAVMETLVPVERMEVPAEALERHRGEVLTADDLIDLMLALDAELSWG